MKIRERNVFTRLLRTRPLFLAAALYLIGCIIGHVLNPAPMVLLICACLAAMTALFLCKLNRRLAAAMLLLILLPLGALRFEGAWKKTDPLPDQKEALLSGRICQTPVWNAETERTICVLEDIIIDENPVEGRLRLYLRGDAQLLQEVELGRFISCEAHIWRADVATNPGEFNFSNYLRLNGLRGYATAIIEDALFSDAEMRPGDWLESMRSATGSRIDRLFPANSAIARAFLLGDRSGLSDEDRESYSISGAAHLLAISGMHVSVLAGLVSFLLGRLLGRRRAFLVTLVLLIAYGALIGFSASLLRAILMFAVFSAAPLAGRFSDGPTRLAGAMLLYLLVRPVAILESSFILSYGACAGVIFLNEPLQRLFGVQRFISKRTDVGFVFFLTHRVPSLIVQSLILTLAAQLAILPAVVHFFGAQPLWSFVVNLLAVPLAMSAYMVALLGTISGIVPVAWLADGLFGLLTACVRFFSELPLATLRIARFPMWLVVICALALFCASDLSKIPEKARRFLPFAVILAVFVSNGNAMLSARGCSIVFLNAGEADCAVIRSEGKIYLVDTGDDYTPAADYLSAMNYSVDGVFLTHPHSDHAGGLMDILEICTPERIYISANWADLEKDDGISEALAKVEELGSEVIAVSAGDEIALSDKTLLEVLSPAAGIQVDAANVDSLVLRLIYGDCSAIFTGDAPASATTGILPDADILKVAHHGSSDSLNAAILTEVSPSAAIIPVGYNTYGHPTEKTLELLDAAGVQVYRTDLHGAITCRLNEDGSFRVRTDQSSEDADGLE